jgi:hypothetical protein
MSRATKAILQKRDAECFLQRRLLQSDAKWPEDSPTAPNAFFATTEGRAKFPAVDEVLRPFAKTTPDAMPS